MKSIINKLYFYTFCLILALSATACGSDEDGDTTAPVINLIAPAEGTILKIGSEIHFDMEVADNEMLRSYKVEIHNAFDGHGHGHDHNHAKAAEAIETKPFSFQKDWDLSGKKDAKIHHHEIAIPADATPGKYHLMVYCTDLSGNESHVARNIELSITGEEGDHDHDHNH